MTKKLKTFYDSPRGKRERLRNRRITIFRKAHELESKCNAQILVIIETSSKRYLYRSENIDRVVKGVTLDELIQHSWPPFQMTEAKDFATDSVDTSNTSSMNGESSESEQEDDDLSSDASQKLPWDIKVVPFPPEIIVSPTVAASHHINTYSQ